MAKKEQFSWTDDETELLLNITLDYKTEKIAIGIDWESIRSKYGDIWERFSAELARMIEEATPGDFPHKPEEITKAMLSSKLKGEPNLTGYIYILYGYIYMVKINACRIYDAIIRNSIIGI